MCGIAGFNWPDKLIIEKMTRSLQHRGPDDQGIHTNQDVSLGHRRLSILDISEKGHQPMHFENLVIVYNGEIYNFLELKEQLKSHGYNFISGTDTEVLLYSYHKWGPACVEKFNGMWAFCISAVEIGPVYFLETFRQLLGRAAQLRMVQIPHHSRSADAGNGILCRYHRHLWCAAAPGETAEGG